ncbi:NACHT domain-containing protein [Nonomuraea endophytica]|uniref:NACHT domain-containing protein n=1 Tax=Nonomuraea endophytica TaxID=714136 RepID=UPI0037C689E7
MANSISYADAVRLIGGTSRTVRLLDALLGGSLLGVSALGLTVGAVGTFPAAAAAGAAALGWFDAKAELVRLGHQLVGSLPDRLTHAARHTRSELLHAAHAVVAVTALFEALDDLSLPFSPKELGLSRTEELALVAAPNSVNFVEALIRVPWLTPTVAKPHDRWLAELKQTYTALAADLWSFTHGLALSDRLNETDLDRARRALRRELPTRAILRYQELYRRLAADFPEFAFWANLREHRATQHSLERLHGGLDGLSDILSTMASGRVPDVKLASLTRANRMVLTHPIAQGDDLPEGLVMPLLGRAYVDPSFRVLESVHGLDLSTERAWDIAEEHDDLPAFLAGQLTSLSAVTAPMLVLGQPGAGKSVLTKMLAARLPVGDFLPIRVPLRQVHADSGIQEQIEEAIRITTGERMSWPDLARSANGALPVVMLDGLDELLQATGGHRADYLMEVTEFQLREAELDRPVATLVTSRSAVADRCRIPTDTIAIRLEPFSMAQMEAWLVVWNNYNADFFATRGLAPLDVGTLSDTTMRDLARQPLLLLMLALYDTDANALKARQESAGGRLDQSELYEQLLRRFALREIDKQHRNLPGPDREELIEYELLRLSVAASAMFNRGRQWITPTELDYDLVKLIPSLRRVIGGFPAPPAAAEVVISRFFFIHQAQAIQRGRRLHTYEFLHASFGEYLIARLIHRVLADVLAETNGSHASSTGQLADAGPDDPLLRALLSFGVLATRQPILRFLSELAGESSAALQALLIGLLRDAHSQTTREEAEYEPVRLPLITRLACYNANLLLTCVMVSPQVAVSRLFPETEDPVAAWQRLTHLWRGAIGDEEWSNIADALMGLKIWTAGTRDLILTSIYHPQVALDPAMQQAIDDPLEWSHGWQSADRPHQWNTRDVWRTVGWSHLLCDPATEVLLHTAAPFFNRLRGCTEFISLPEGPAMSVGRVLTDLWLGSGISTAPVLQPHRYRRALHVLHHLPDDPSPQAAHPLTLIINQIQLDLDRLDLGEARDLLSDLLPYLRDTDATLLDAATACVLRLVIRDQANMTLLNRYLGTGRLSKITYLTAAVTLMEMDVDPPQVSAHAIQATAELTLEELEEIERVDPHLFHRMRRIVKTDGDRYRLRWPG